MADLQFFILFGGPGLIVGGILGAILPRWRLVIALIAFGAIGAWFGVEYFAREESDENHPFGALGALMTVANLAGWAVGLTGGALSRTAMRAELRCSLRLARGPERTSLKLGLGLVLVVVALLLWFRAA